VLSVDSIHIVLCSTGEYERQQSSLLEQTREQQVTTGEELAYLWYVVKDWSPKINPVYPLHGN